VRSSISSMSMGGIRTRSLVSGFLSATVVIVSQDGQEIPIAARTEPANRGTNGRSVTVIAFTRWKALVTARRSSDDQGSLR